MHGDLGLGAADIGSHLFVDLVLRTVALAWRSALAGPTVAEDAFSRNIETRHHSARAFVPCLSPSLKARVAAETDGVRVA